MNVKAEARKWEKQIGVHMYVVVDGCINHFCVPTPCQVVSSTALVFASWDDEYDKLQQILRDMAKKKHYDSLKTMWRVNPSHKKLQARLDNMRK